MQLATVTQISLYPVKSVRGWQVSEAEVAPEGLSGDRRWMVVDTDGNAITGREVGALVQATASYAPNGDMILSHASLGEVQVAGHPKGGQGVDVTLWGDRVVGVAPSREADAWFTQLTGRPCRVVYMPPTSFRSFDGEAPASDNLVGFADAFPVLVVSQASLDQLSRRCSEPMQMARFRPNIVVGGCPPHGEDDWGRIRIGEALLESTGACERCSFVTVHPDSGERHPRQEPLRTLTNYRRGPDGAVHFGLNLRVCAGGSIKIGDTVKPV